MATEGKKQIFWIPTTVRYIKLQFNAFPYVNADLYEESIVQMSMLNFIDKDCNMFMWNFDNIICIDHSEFLTTGLTGKWYTKDLGGECAEMLFDMTTDTKLCLRYFKTLPFYVTFDLGSACLDITKYDRYQWYTANDTVKYPTRSPMSWQLYMSANGDNFILVDNVENYANLPNANNTLAYTSGHLKALG